MVSFSLLILAVRLSLQFYSLCCTGGQHTDPCTSSFMTMPPSGLPMVYMLELSCDLVPVHAGWLYPPFVSLYIFAFHYSFKYSLIYFFHLHCKFGVRKFRARLALLRSFEQRRVDYGSKVFFFSLLTSFSFHFSKLPNSLSLGFVRAIFPVKLSLLHREHLICVGVGIVLGCGIMANISTNYAVS